MQAFRRWVGVVVPVVLLVGCDHATKFAAKAQLQDQGPRRVLSSVLNLEYVENRDVAFNLLRFVPEHARHILLTAFGALAILALAGVVARGYGTRGTRVALLLILAGAAGNYLDRVVRGYVVDFIYVRHWPVFNVADVLVVVGAALLIWERRAVARSSKA